ncbi:MAG: hypothetical protein WBA13_10265 [Microcoleaceae cyanobacterium]
MKLLKKIGIILGILAIPSTAQAAQLTLGFDAFIPTARIANPAAEVLPPFFTEFIGDNRDFNLEATTNGQSRLFTQVILDSEAPNPLVSTFSGTGTTIGFLIENGIEVSQSAKGTPTSSVEATRIGDNEILLEVAARAVNPLIENFLPPDVEGIPAEYTYDIVFDFSDDKIQYELTGTNREYPSYSVFLNQTAILLNPANGEDANLLGNIEFVTASGTISVDEPGTLSALIAVGASLLVGYKKMNRKVKF